MDDMTVQSLSTWFGWIDHIGTICDESNDRVFRSMAGTKVDHVVQLMLAAQVPEIEKDRMNAFS